jgi:hypothetical protein
VHLSEYLIDYPGKSGLGGSSFMYRLIVLALALVISGFFIFNSSTAQNKSDGLPNHIPQLLKDWKLEETYKVTVVNGSLSPRQIEHSKALGDDEAGSEEGHLKNYKRGEGTVIMFNRGDAVQDPDAVEPNLTNYFSELASRYDVIAIVKPKFCLSSLTLSGGLIFTEYDMSVEEVIKDNPAAKIDSAKGITVIRRGGAVEINGRRFIQVEERFFPFQLGRRYLLFLKHLPSTGAYVAEYDGSFWLQDKKVISLGSTVHPSKLKDEKKFKSLVCAAVGGCGVKTQPTASNEEIVSPTPMSGKGCALCERDKDDLY